MKIRLTSKKLLVLLCVASVMSACSAPASQSSAVTTRPSVAEPQRVPALPTTQTLPTPIAPLVSAASTTTLPVTTHIPLVTLNSGELPFLGLNYPWSHYGHDFGIAWGHDGVSAEQSRAAIEADFADMKRHGVQAVRWFLWADGRASPEFDADDNVTGFDDYFYADLDAALAIAEKYDIDLVLVLFDFHWFEAPKIENDVQLFGRAETIADPQKRRSLLDNALLPLLDRYGSHKRIMAWDIINEPEGGMIVPEGNWVTQAISETLMQAFVSEVVDLIHARATQPVTLGSASRGTLKYWTGRNLDFYQFHYYDHMEAQFPLDVPYASLGLDRPAIVGEFPSRGSQYTVTQYLDIIRNNGYSGAFPWSYRAGDEASDFASQAAVYCEWARTHTAGQESLDCAPLPPTLMAATPVASCSAHLDSPHGSTPFGGRACSPDGTRYAREVDPAHQGQIGIFDQATDQLLLTIKASEQNNNLKGLAWPPDNRWLAYMFHHGSGGYIAIVDAQTGQQVRRIPIQAWYHTMEFSPDGTHLLVSASNVEPAQLKAWP